MKEPLVILHGALGAKSQFENIAAYLNDQFDIHLINFSGHGGESFADDFSIQQFTKELNTYLKDNNLVNVNVFGYSMGGYVALNSALNENSPINKIYTLATKFDWSPETATQEIKMLNPEKIEAKVPVFAKALKKRHEPNDWHMVLEKTSELMTRLGENPLVTINTVGSVKIRVNIGIGDQDNMVSIEESEAIASGLPNGGLKIFKGFEHPIEKAELSVLVNDLKGFFR